jgi:hypothetical protein
MQFICVQLAQRACTMFDFVNRPNNFFDKIVCVDGAPCGFCSSQGLFVVHQHCRALGLSIRDAPVSTLPSCRIYIGKVFVADRVEILDAKRIVAKSFVG